MLPTMFRFIQPSGFRVEDLKKQANQKQKLPVVAMFVNGSGQNEQSVQRTFHRLKCEKLTDDRRRTPSNGKNSHCLWQGELKTLYKASTMKSL